MSLRAVCDDVSLRMQQQEGGLGHTINTGSSAALNRSYFARAAKRGMNRSGVTIIRLVTATNTALFSPGRDFEGATAGTGATDEEAGLLDFRGVSFGPRPIADFSF